ncbi:hypothetical protein, partial [Mycoplasmopsis bovis]|uniref:hypothetical protein n=1 Tax=Mycoplasmopsis bovis TaxID=28903 RepID=UPI003D2CBCE3
NLHWFLPIQITNNLASRNKKQFPWIHSLLLETINNETNYDFSNILVKQDDLAIRDYFKAFSEIVDFYDYLTQLIILRSFLPY